MNWWHCARGKKNLKEVLFNDQIVLDRKKEN
jgi:hypothetical protein